MDETIIPITGEEDVGHARRLVVQKAQELAFPAQKCDELALLSTELATNLLVHQAVEGELLLHRVTGAESEGIELLSRDRGPGIKDLRAAQRDGHSTGGSMGVGLGTIKRLSDHFEIFSCQDPSRQSLDLRKLVTTQPGTIVLARKWRHTPPSDHAPIFMTSIPTEGESANGDGVWLLQEPHRTRMAISDGLGHGHAAQEATCRALSYIKDHPNDDLLAIITALQGELRGTRGCALSLIEIDEYAKILRYITVGNITLRLLSPHKASVFSPQPGVLGMRLHNKPRVRQLTLPEEATLFAFSDGLSGRWSFEKDDELWQHDPSLLGTLLMRDHRRPHDDTTLLIARIPQQESAR